MKRRSFPTGACAGRWRQPGFTLVELLIVVAVLGVIAALAAPSFRQMIVEERLRGVHAQLVTDLNFTRTEAVARGRYLDFRVRRDTTTGDTCYIIFERSSSSGTNGCNCLVSTNRCPAGLQEVRAVSLRASDGIQVAEPALGSATWVRVEPRNGAMHLSVADLAGVLPQPFEVQTTLVGTNASLRARVALSGQVFSCVPSGSTMKGSAC